MIGYINGGQLLTNGSLKIGGRNILRNTDPTDDLISGAITGEKWVCSSGGNGTGSLIDLDKRFMAKKGFRITGNTNLAKDFNQRPIHWQPSIYTFSIYARIVPNSKATYNCFYVRSWSTLKSRPSFASPDIQLTNDWKLYTYSIDATSFWQDETSSIAFGVNGSSEADFAEPKLELGNVPTDWTKAPEDIESEIQALKSKLGG